MEEKSKKKKQNKLIENKNGAQRHVQTDERWIKNQKRWEDGLIKKSSWDRSRHSLCTILKYRKPQKKKKPKTKNQKPKHRSEPRRALKEDVCWLDDVCLVLGMWRWESTWEIWRRCERFESYAPSKRSPLFRVRNFNINSLSLPLCLTFLSRRWVYLLLCTTLK